MTLSELLKKTEEKFEKEFKLDSTGFDTPIIRKGKNTYETLEPIKSFLLSSLEEAYKLGEENMKENWAKTLRALADMYEQYCIGIRRIWRSRRG